jgi:hypothetical protein
LAALLGGALAVRAWLQPGVPPPRLTDFTALGNLVLAGVAGAVVLIVALAPHSSGRTGLLIGAGLLLLPTGAGYGSTPDSVASLGGLFAFVAGALAMTRTVHWGRALVVVVVTVLAGIALAIVSAEGLRAVLQ